MHMTHHMFPRCVAGGPLQLACGYCVHSCCGVYRLCDPRGGVVVWRCLCFLCRAQSAVLCCVAVEVINWEAPACLEIAQGE